MGNSFGFMWEYSLISFLQNNLNPLIMKYFSFIANFADEIAVVLIVGFLYWCYDKKIGFKVLMYVCIGGTLFPMLKNIVCRIRPYMVNENIKCIKPAYDGDPNSIVVQGYSFPSGHSVNALLVYGPIIKKYKNSLLRIILTLIIVSICISRVALGVHYPTDVLAGLVLAMIIWLGYDLLTNKFSINKVNLVLIGFTALGFLYCSSDDFFTGYGMLVGASIACAFEKKYVNFKNTKDVKEIIARLLIGLVVFLLLSMGLKLPFKEEFLNSGTLLSHLVRTIRYTIIMFVAMGLYPMCFKFIRFKKK